MRGRKGIEQGRLKWWGIGGEFGNGKAVVWSMRFEEDMREESGSVGRCFVPIY
ncbi:hypothetical protein MCU_01423 [Bartonella elizabethae Re6043vi]|uniref:Uncharacterized protein n=2 Tax=Bartonella elizabethae TaxID=807 RepID=J0R4M8_BAREL|nr:hypothetical protein MCU_01423 [Bartonella elizabethae Re6043vi]EJF93516.1 hypothetical protein MEE_01462 [Bartonella elizabethae F9251 = ATCC 49927]VEJ41875.1 Uncharacterised protein [Bartonella elizabethae]